MEKYNLLTSINALTLVIFIIWVMCWFINNVFSGARDYKKSTKEDFSSLMKKNVISKRVLVLLFKILVSVIWFKILGTVSNIKVGDNVLSILNDYLSITIFAISIINFLIILMVLESVKKLMIGIIAMVKQRKNTAHNNLLKAVDEKEAKDIVFYFKVLKQSGFPIKLTEYNWLIVLSALVEEKRVAEAESLSANIVRNNKIKYKSPLYKSYTKINSVKSYFTSLFGKKDVPFKK